MDNVVALLMAWELAQRRTSRRGKGAQLPKDAQLMVKEMYETMFPPLRRTMREQIRTLRDEIRTFT